MRGLVAFYARAAGVTSASGRRANFPPERDSAVEERERERGKCVHAAVAGAAFSSAGPFIDGLYVWPRLDSVPKLRAFKVKRIVR